MPIADIFFSISQETPRKSKVEATTTERETSCWHCSHCQIALLHLASVLVARPQGNLTAEPEGCRVNEYWPETAGGVAGTVYATLQPLQSFALTTIDMFIILYMLRFEAILVL